MEVEYYPSTLDHFFYNEEAAVLTSQEMKCIRSLKTIVVDDPQIISAVAHEVGDGHHMPPIREPAFSTTDLVHFVCYKGDERLTAFTVLPFEIVTEQGNWFKYDGYLESAHFIPPQIRPLVVRGRCARNLASLYSHLGSLFGYRKTKAWSQCVEWCDALLRGESQDKATIESHLRCPSVSEGRSHYAMNANWRPHSPPNTVILFETIAGWNKCGGPELFTFDDHEPRGGLVLLSGSGVDWFDKPTVRFIRTAEELKQLRWK